MIKQEQVIEALKEVIDPELFIDIWTLELIYDIKVEDDNVFITMTFTTPLCPYGPQLLEDIKNKLNEVKGIKKVKVKVTFEPKWEPTPELRSLLGV